MYAKEEPAARCIEEGASGLHPGGEFASGLLGFHDAVLIRIIRMNDDGGKDLQARKYNGRSGVVEHIDSIGQLHGTWGGLAVIPGVDEIEVKEI